VLRPDRRPGREAVHGQALWVLHASEAYTRSHLELAPDEVLPRLHEALHALLVRPPHWRHYAVHVQRYAMPPWRQGAAAAWWDVPIGLGVCGDFLGGPADRAAQGAWQPAQALIAVISAPVAVAVAQGSTETKPMQAFDTGAAWMRLALQVHKTGWRTHAMGGFGTDALRKALGVPDTVVLHCVVAVGEQCDKAVLDQALQTREAPSARQPLSAMVCDRRFALHRRDRGRPSCTPLQTRPSVRGRQHDVETDQLNPVGHDGARQGRATSGRSKPAHRR
jgi:hypothetical protein